MRLILAALAIVALCSCAAKEVHTDPGLADDVVLLRALDRAVDQAGCRNQAEFQFAGSPHLRTSRFWQAIARRGLNNSGFALWLEQLRENDRAARAGEISCLGDQGAHQLLETLAPGSGVGLAELAEQSAQRLLEADRLRGRENLADLARVTVPDDYSLLLRTLGLYPLARIPFVFGVHNAYEMRREWFRQPLSELVMLDQTHEVGPPAGRIDSEAEIAEILTAAAANPLGVPLPDAGQARALVEYFAPIFQQEELSVVDHWGEVKVEGDRILIGAERVVYYYLDHLLVEGQPLLRLNYLVWHAGRDGEVVPWFERGWLDGVTYGLVLDPRGRPLIASTMNNCGCYLQYYPVVDRVVKKEERIDLLVPQELPSLQPGERIAVTMTSGWHQVVRMAGAEAIGAKQYRLQPYNALGRLSRPDGRTRNLFDDRGVLRGTERAERFFFFGMGIPSVGSMRQRGHHPVTLLGRQHYDDPELLDDSFRFKDF